MKSGIADLDAIKRSGESNTFITRRPSLASFAAMLRKIKHVRSAHVATSQVNCVLHCRLSAAYDQHGPLRLVVLMLFGLDGGQYVLQSDAKLRGVYHNSGELRQLGSVYR